VVDDGEGLPVVVVVGVLPWVVRVGVDDLVDLVDVRASPPFSGSAASVAVLVCPPVW
jgi:hypothetical protein